MLHQDANGIDADWCGTGFFVSVPGLVVPTLQFHVFVTAKHISDALKDKSVCFAVNKKGGGITHIGGNLGSWWTHPSDATADVAVLPFNMTSDLDIISVAMTDFLTPDVIVKKNIGIGDEVFMTGLFTFVPSAYAGVQRNMPIVRHGNIAMLPDQAIQTDYGYAEVYLVEARSIGGLSGSPVFALQTIALKVKADEGETWVHGVGGMHLLGVMHGHWDIRESEMNKPHYMHDEKRGVNLGIGIVVPAHKIIETINRPELVDWRKEYEQEVLRARTPGPDSGENVEPSK